MITADTRVVKGLMGSGLRIEGWGLRVEDSGLRVDE